MFGFFPLDCKFPRDGVGTTASLRRGGRSGVALRRAHSCRDELPSLQVHLSPDPQIPGLHCMDYRTVGERKRNSHFPRRHLVQSPDCSILTPWLARVRRSSGSQPVPRPSLNASCFPSHRSGQICTDTPSLDAHLGFVPTTSTPLPKEELVLYPSKGKRESMWGLQRAWKGPNRSQNRKSSHNRHYDILTPCPSSTLSHLQPVSHGGKLFGARRRVGVATCIWRCGVIGGF